MYFIPHCFICRPSVSTVTEDAGMKPRTRVSFETSFDSKQQKLEPKLVSALSETQRLFRLFRFHTETESFDVSIEPKQTNSLIGSIFCNFLQKIYGFFGFFGFFRFFFGFFGFFGFFQGFFGLFRNSLFRCFGCFASISKQRILIDPKLCRWLQLAQLAKGKKSRP